MKRIELQHYSNYWNTQSHHNLV